MADYKRADGTTIISLNYTEDNSQTGTALARFNQWCTEMGTVVTSGSGMDGDDACWCITTQNTLNLNGIDFVPRFMFSSEAGFGLYSSVPSDTSSTNSPPQNVSRMYVTNNRPALLITYHLPGIDMSSSATQYKTFNDGFCIYASHQYYGGGNNFYVAIKVCSFGIYMYFERGSSTTSIPVYLNLWNSSNSSWTQTLLTTFLASTSHSLVGMENLSFKSSGYVVYGPYDVSTSCKISTVKSVPTNTSITYQYSTDNTNWVSVTENDSIPSSGSLYIKVILGTSNVKVTPSLSELWLSSVDVPEDTILLKTGDQNRFNNVEGALTIAYDSTKGRLNGSGGPVLSFSETYTPTELFKKPNPGVYEKITSSVSLNNFNFTQVTYKKGYEAEKITVTPSCSIVFTYVGTVNP